MKVGIVGTGAIAGKHAQAYKNIGYELTACTDRTIAKGRDFSAKWGADFVATPDELARRIGWRQSSLARSTRNMCWCRSRWLLSSPPRRR